jgi:hypothetical protein
MNVIASVFGDIKQQRVLNAQINAAATVLAPPQDLYALLKAYYYNNSLYDRMTTLLGSVGEATSEIKGLRNPAFRTVEFYVGHVWNGELTIDPESTTDTLITDMNTIWDWCNWKQRKSLAVRWCSLYGDLFIKVVRDDPGNHVGFQLINPETVSLIKRDVLHGDVTYIRIDTPIETEIDAQTGFRTDLKVRMHTEEWDLKKDTFKLWEHDKNVTTVTGKLGTPIESARISEEFGIDFLPFVHVMFRDVGENRGVGAFTLQIDKIDEVNRMATRLNHILYRYNRVLYALKSNSMDKDGRPIPAPQIGNTNTRRNQTDDGTVELGGDRFIRLPGMASLELLVPQIDYSSHLNTIKNQMDELAEDLPEMEYYKMRDNADISARAVWYKMSPALKRAAEFRMIMDAALVKADKMALIIASKTRAITNQYGSTTAPESHGEMLRDPALTHVLNDRPLLELSEIDQAELERSKIEMIGAKKAAGVDTRTILEEMGYDNVEEMIERKKQELLDMQDTFQQATGPFPSNTQNKQQDQRENGKVRDVRGFEGQ